MEEGGILINSTKLAKLLMPVQPLVGPTGLVYYLRWRHAEEKRLRELEKFAENVDWKKEGF